ncbi:hypothetical protein ACNO5E_13450 [Vibrio parahaemolyticus]
MLNATVLSSFIAHLVNYRILICVVPFLLAMEVFSFFGRAMTGAESSLAMPLPLICIDLIIFCLLAALFMNVHAVCKSFKKAKLAGYMEV